MSVLNMGIFSTNYKNPAIGGEKRTNADRIRSMSDDELAFYIVNHPMWSDESACVAWLKESISGVKNENLN